MKGEEDNATKVACRQQGYNTLNACIGNMKTVLPIKTQFITGFVVAAIVKGQAYRGAYWIAWHLYAGAEHIIIFDNGKNSGLSSLTYAFT